jgi:hypothetical protein
VPDGIASVTPANPPRVVPSYVELNRYGLLFAAKQFELTPWGAANDPVQQLHFGNLLHTLLNVFVCARRFYESRGYRGGVTVRSSLNGIQGQVMMFREAVFMGDDMPDEFRSYTNDVSVERMMDTQLDQAQRGELFTDMLAEITWSFWQGNGEYPRAHLAQNLQRHLRRL